MTFSYDFSLPKTSFYKSESLGTSGELGYMRNHLHSILNREEGRDPPRELTGGQFVCTKIDFWTFFLYTDGFFPASVKVWTTADTWKIAVTSVFNPKSLLREIHLGITMAANLSSRKEIFYTFLSQKNDLQFCPLHCQEVLRSWWELA